jgi:hypothetical protein
MNNLLWILSIFFCSIFFTTQIATAQCTSTGSGSWSNSGTWTGCGGSIPTSSSNVVIASSTITLNLSGGTVTVANLTINNGQTLSVVGGGRLIVTGNLTMNQMGMGNTNFFISGGAFIEIRGNFISGSNGNNVSVDGSGTGGSFLIRGCYTVGMGSPNPGNNVIGGSNLTWCVSNDSNCGNQYQSTGGCNTLLPVTLISFTGKLVRVEDNLRENQKIAKIAWTSVNETNNDFYTVEKSTDGIDFQEFARIKGAGTINELRNYEVDDYTPFEGITYYRLKQTDFDGTYTYTKVIAVETYTNLSIYPNPLHAKEKQLAIHIHDKLYTDLVVSVLELSGKVVTQFIFNRQQGNVYSLALPTHIAQGIYLVHIKTNNQLIIKKLLIL